MTETIPVLPASTPRLFIDIALTPAAVVPIDGAAAHYLLNVLRLNGGDPVKLFDNQTGEWLARVADTGRRDLRLLVDMCLRPMQPSPDLWLCFAPIKKAQIDWLVEKATELGVARLVPVITERTIVDRVNLARLRSIAVEAAEQSDRTDLPFIAEPVKLPALLRDWDPARALLFADETGGADAAVTMAAAGPVAALLIGPEGGFTVREHELLVAQSVCRPFTLGPRILRAETAALAATALWMAHGGDWQVSSI